MLCYEFIHGVPPFEETNGTQKEAQKETMKRIKAVDVRFPRHLARHPHVPVGLSPEARSLIELFLKLEPADRYPLGRVPTHPWIVQHCGAPAMQ